jgi:lipopolysaccharide transport system permease protein
MTSFRPGFDDLATGARNVDFWAFMAHHEVKQRYRRSYLGPFWVTITTGIMVGAIGTIYGGIIGSDAARYMPHLAVSFVLWSFISQSILDGCQMFLEAGGAMRQMKMPRSTFLYKTLYRNVLLLLHNAVVILAVFLLFGVFPGWPLVMVPLGLALLFANVAWMVLVSGILCARFRDVPPIIMSALQLLFFATPVLWMPEALPPHLSLVMLNPFFHLIAVVRDPLLGHWPDMMSVGVCAVMALLGWAAALRLLSRTRKRIVFWV